MSSEILDGTEFTGFRVNVKEPALSPVVQAACPVPVPFQQVFYQTYEDCRTQVIRTVVEYFH